MKEYSRHDTGDRIKIQKLITKTRKEERTKKGNSVLENPLFFRVFLLSCFRGNYFPVP